jgi:hypothetical protein
MGSLGKGNTMADANTGPILLVVVAILVTTIALLVTATGNAPPSVLAACAQALQALSRGLLWFLSQQDDPRRDEPDDNNPRST